MAGQSLPAPQCDAQGACCPAGYRMRSRGLRLRQKGRTRRYQMDGRLCQTCPWQPLCWKEARPGQKKRCFYLPAPEIPLEPAIPALCAPPEAPDPPQRSVIPETVPEHEEAFPTTWIAHPHQTVWVDLAATQARRSLWSQTWNQRVQTPLGVPRVEPKQPKNRRITRDQRAHRRLSYAARWERNQRHTPIPFVLHHISKELASFCGLFSSA